LCKFTEHFTKTEAPLSQSIRTSQRRLRAENAYSLGALVNNQELINVLLKYKNLSGAVMSNDIKAARIFIDHGFISDFKNKQSPLLIAISQRNYEISKLLIDHGHPLDFNGHQPFILSAIQHNCINILELLLERGADPNKKVISENASLDLLMCDFGISDPKFAKIRWASSSLYDASTALGAVLNLSHVIFNPSPFNTESRLNSYKNEIVTLLLKYGAKI